MDPISIILVAVLSIAVMGTEVLMFFLIFRVLARVFRSRWVETLNGAGKPLIEPTLTILAGWLPTVRRIKEPPLLALAFLSVSILRMVLAWMMVQL